MERPVPVSSSWWWPVLCFHLSADDKEQRRQLWVVAMQWTGVCVLEWASRWELMIHCWLLV